jgi:2-dehydro-3-deoxygluconokinase
MSILTFGEIMMRLSPEGTLRFRQAMPGRLEVMFTGGEANVAASLATLGMTAGFITILPKHTISECVLAELRKMNIDTRYIKMSDKGRLGIFYLETGSNQRSSVVIYDRDASSISLTKPDEYDFETVFTNEIQWLHTTGITPALSENAFASTLAAVSTAKAKGIRVSCDLNFRKKLWRWKAGYRPEQLAKESMTAILPYVDVVIANEEDAKDVLGIEAEETSIETGKINTGGYKSVAKKIVERFPNVRQVAITLRESFSADHNNWGAMLYDATLDRFFLAPLDGEGNYQPYQIKDIVDRVGGGDSFAAGLIYALLSKEYSDPATAIRFAVAASCLKHSIRGDFNYTTKDEVVALMNGSASGRIRR